MRRPQILPSLIVILFVSAAGVLLAFQMNREVQEIFTQNCSVSGCHQGQFPPMGLNLEEDKYLDSLINVPSREKPSLKLADPGNPEESYLYLKITGAENIEGQRMPAQAPPLSGSSIQTIRNWIQNHESDSRQFPEEKNVVQKPVFWAPEIMNLPTPRSIGKNKWLFRVAHRFLPSVKQGYGAAYGWDGPALVLLSFGYGLNDDMGITLSRTSGLQEFGLSCHWTFSRRNSARALPLTMTIVAGGNLITKTRPDENLFDPSNLRFNLQYCLAYQLNDSLSLELVPGYSFNTNPDEQSEQGTLSLGFGGRYIFFNDFSILLEFVPVLSGYSAEAAGWGAGLEKKIGGHVFQIFILNSTGLTAPQYMPGGDLKIGEGDFRFGFSIYRWF